MPELTERGKAFRTAIKAFIEARREIKLKGNAEDCEKAAKYDYTSWLADAARRVGQIQAVTHVLKATHPDARGSSLHVSPRHLASRPEIGSHVLGDDFAEDVVGNAAALDVFKFLKTEVHGRRLLDWMRESDADLQTALHDDPATAGEWMKAFASLVREERQPASHPMAKQVYWLAGDEPADNHAYHLLQPLFSSSLAHAVHADIQDARFGEGNKLARQAFRARSTHDLPYRDYRHLVIRKLGGTKPQNISQLNSDRGGVNYLLAALPPPPWQREQLPKLLHQDSALPAFQWFDGVRPLLKALTDLLLADPDANKETRTQREALEESLGLQLSLYAASIHAQTAPGWTRSMDCELPLCEQIWLDPERIELPPRNDPAHPEWDRQDHDFNRACEQGNWPDEVAGRFAHWVNERLREAGLTTVGDAECKHWAKQAIVDAAWPATLQGRATGGVA